MRTPAVVDIGRFVHVKLALTLILCIAHLQTHSDGAKGEYMHHHALREVVAPRRCIVLVRDVSGGPAHRYLVG